ncbi:AzlC family ABC transporter permease [Tistrella sp. BH-R2-4]|uniref:AzlC family ABC transporter permease n=1 Tax=Tistrella arctica TaxID=3133430 RepID=A0ABU9YMT9_9PROT
MASTISSSARPVRSALRRSWPVCLAVSPVGLLFGILAAAQGWAVLEVLGIAMIGFTGSGQFVWLRLAAEGGPALAGFAVILLINLRYVPMILTISAPFRGTGPLKGVAAHMVSDESYAVEAPGDDRRARWTVRGALFVTWTTTNLAGALIMPLIAGTEAAAVLGLLAFFPASLLLFTLSVLRLEAASRDISGRPVPRMVLAIAAAAGLALMLYLALGPQWFWLPGILVCAVVVDRFGFGDAAAADHARAISS